MNLNHYVMEDALESLIDYRGKTPQKSDTGIPTLSAKSVKNGYIDYRECYYISSEEYKRFMVRGFPKVGDVLLTTEAPMGMVARLDRDDVGIAQRLITLRGKEGILDNNYLLYYLQSPIGQHKLAERETGSTVTGIKQAEFRKIEIDIPNIDVQRKIAACLICIDAKIENNKQINRNLSEQVAALYKAWFIDFERNDGVCPEEWKEATLGDIAEIGSGKRPPMKQADKTDDVCIPLVGAASIMGYTNSVLYDSKILVTGRVGTHGVVQRFNNECWPSDNTLVITTDKYEFVNQILLGIDYKSMNRGSTQPLITQGDLKKTEIILPTDAILDEFEALAGGLMNQYEKNVLENAKLSELRDTLLPKLMSGELDVSDLKL